MLAPYWWMRPPFERIIFIFVILIALTIARWLWKMGDVWNWGEERDSTAKRGLLDSSKEKNLDEIKE